MCFEKLVAMILLPLMMVGNLWAGTSGKFHTQVSLVSERSEIAPGESFDVGLLLKMEEHWHTYWKNPGDAGLATSVTWTLPAGFTADPIRWPKPQVMETGPLTTYVYEGEVLLLVRVHAPKEGHRPGQKVKLEGEVTWQECNEICILGSTAVSLSLPVAKTSKEASADVKALFDKYMAQIPPDDYDPSKEKPTTASGSGPQPASLSTKAPLNLWIAILFGFIGGMTLNIMPCVLPIIAIKILSFVRQSNDEPGRVRRLGLMFGLGVVVSFWILAAVFLVFRIGWGSPLNMPEVQMALALVMTVVALNLFGVFEFELGTAASQRAGELASREGYTGAFLNGVLATALATPCTAPFLAPALGYAFAQPVSVTVSVFTAIGMGFAFPYTLLTWQPKLLKWMPKPGTWMLRFKEAMGFPMIAVALWLVWCLGAIAGSDAACLVLGWLLLASFAVWLTSVLSSKRLSWIFAVLAVICFLGYRPVYPWVRILSLSATAIEGAHSDSGIAWQPYSKEALDEALKTSRPIFVDFESQACLTCKVNKPVFSDPKVIQRFKELDVIPLHAWWTQQLKLGESDEDWKKREKVILDALKSFDRDGVPLYVIYPPDRTKPPIQLPDGWIHVQTVLDALEKAVGRKT